MIVFGDAELVTNRELTRSASRMVSSSLAISSLEWMAERESVGIQPKVSSVYTLQKLVPGDIERMVYVPGWLMFLPLVGLGAGIWIVRRR